MIDIFVFCHHVNKEKTFCRYPHSVYGRPRTILDTKDHKINTAFQTDLQQFGGYLEYIYKPIDVKTRTSAFLNPANLALIINLDTVKKVYANQRFKIDLLGKYQQHIPLLRPRNSTRNYEGKLRTVLKVP